MSKRFITWAVIIIIIIILVLAGYFGYNMYLKKPIVDNNQLNQSDLGIINGTNDQINNNVAVNPPQLVAPQDDAGKLKLLASVFTANYGSYSNQTSLSNFDDFYSYMSDTMKKWIESTYKKEIMAEHPKDVYYAIETKVLKIQVNKLDDTAGTAELLINTQRQEFKESPDNFNVFKQDLLLNLVKVDDNWIIDSAYWQ